MITVHSFCWLLNVDADGDEFKAAGQIATHN